MPPASHLERALALHRQGRLAEAELLYQQLLRQQPRHFAAQHMLGVIALQSGRLEQAITLLTEALVTNPGVAAAHCNLGHALLAADRLADAVGSYADAIALQPDLAEAHAGHGRALHALHELDAAIDSYDRAIALRPAIADTQVRRADALLARSRYATAIAGYDAALALRPELVDARINRATALHGLGRHAEAMAGYADAVAQAPEFAEAHLTRSLWRLKLGDLPDGWREFEWRWQTAAYADSRREFRQPLWLGEADPAGKIILVHAEQGLGDTIQFCRYAPLLAARGAQVVLEVQRPLLRLLQSLDCGVVLAAGDPLPAFDLHCPLMSLPLAFGTTLETIPADTPYLGPDPAQAARWKQRLGALPGLRVGLCWAGNPAATPIDARRSMAFSQLATLTQVPGISLVSLQTGDAARQAGAARILDVSGELADFADTAAVVMALDLVISVDTAVAHLAGALGKPVWLLNRFDGCWRWMIQRHDSPWYPTLRVFRQAEPGDWASMVDQVAADLRAISASSSRSDRSGSCRHTPLA